MTWYKTGTVAVTPGSNAVIGTGTAFIRNARVGDAFRGPDGEWYEVINIASDTALSIAPNFQGVAVAAGGYSLAPMQGYVKDSADALRAATQVIASGVADMQEQVSAATEAAESAGQSKAVATEQAGIATAAAETSTDNKDAAQLAAQQSQDSAQASGSAAERSETARDSIVQSEQAAAASAAAAADSAEQAEAVTVGKAGSGDNNDITSLRAINADGFDRIRQGIAAVTGATATVAGQKGLAPAPAAGEHTKFLSGAGAYIDLPIMTGATTSAAGKPGVLPAPAIGDLRFFASDGTWQAISTQRLSASVKGFGDSNTVGLGLSSTAYNYINRESEIAKIPFVNNAVNSACTWDQAVQVYATNLAVNESSQIMIGTNDSRRYGTTANDLDTFKRAHASLTAWLAIPELGKVRATNPLITYTGNWGDSAAYPALTLRGSPAIGAVASFTFTGTTLYFSTARTNVTGTRASATVRIDGVVVGTVTTQGFSSNTILGANYGPALYRFGGLSAGQHTVTITTVTADAQNLFFVEWFAVPDAANLSRPVNVLNIARQTAAGGGVDATTIAYNTAISDNVAMLVADGYRINLADVFSTINPATDLQADGLHFNLQGHTKVAGVASSSLLKF